MIKQSKVNEERQKEGKLYTCEDRHHSKTEDFYFIPPYIGSLKPNGNMIHTKAGRCFKDMRLEGSLLKKNDEYEFKVTVDLHKPVDWECSEKILFGTAERLHYEDYFFHGTHHLTFKNLK